MTTGVQPWIEVSVDTLEPKVMTNLQSIPSLAKLDGVELTNWGLHTANVGQNERYTAQQHVTIPPDAVSTLGGQVIANRVADWLMAGNPRRSTTRLDIDRHYTRYTHAEIVKAIVRALRERDYPV